MKTNIIYIQSYDTLESTLEKIAWTQSERTLLVLPGRPSILRSQLEQQQILRKSERLGTALAIVTNDRDIIYYANRLGIPVFRSIRRANNLNWSHTHPKSPHTQNLVITNKRKELKYRLRSSIKKPSPLSPTIQIIFFSLGVFALLAIAIVLLPGARVKIYPQLKTQELQIHVKAHPDLNTVSLSGGLPVSITQITVEGRQSIPTSGSISIPQSVATGEVTFTNLTDKPVTIPTGTGIHSSLDPTIKFITLEDVLLPSLTGAGSTVSVQAVSPGEKSNLPAGSLTVIESFLGLDVSVTNEAPTTGGSTDQSTAPAKQDYETLRDTLLAALAESALEEVSNTGFQNNIIVSPEASLTSILEETFLPATTEPAAELSLTLRAEFEFWVVSTADLTNLANAVLDTELPASYIPVAGSLDLENVSEPSFDKNGYVTWELSAKRDLQTSISSQKTASMVVGLSPKQARTRLMEVIPFSAPPDISIFPSWWPRMPILSFRINISINEVT
jgi:hypothetical protein